MLIFLRRLIYIIHLRIKELVTVYSIFPKVKITANMNLNYLKETKLTTIMPQEILLVYATLFSVSD